MDAEQKDKNREVGDNLKENQQTIVILARYTKSIQMENNKVSNFNQEEMPHKSLSETEDTNDKKMHSTQNTDTEDKARGNRKKIEKS